MGHNMVVLESEHLPLTLCLKLAQSGCTVQERGHTYNVHRTQQRIPLYLYPSASRFNQ